MVRIRSISYCLQLFFSAQTFSHCIFPFMFFFTPFILNAPKHLLNGHIKPDETTLYRTLVLAMGVDHDPRGGCFSTLILLVFMFPLLHCVLTPSVNWMQPDRTPHFIQSITSPLQLAPAYALGISIDSHPIQRCVWVHFHSALVTIHSLSLISFLRYMFFPAFYLMSEHHPFITKICAGSIIHRIAKSTRMASTCLAC